MPKVKLAYWYDGKKPGDTVDVDDVTLKILKRDGIVAEATSVPDVAPKKTPVSPESDKPADVPQTGSKAR